MLLIVLVQRVILKVETVDLVMVLIHHNHHLYLIILVLCESNARTGTATPSLSLFIGGLTASLAYRGPQVGRPIGCGPTLFFPS